MNKIHCFCSLLDYGPAFPLMLYNLLPGEFDEMGFDRISGDRVQFGVNVLVNASNHVRDGCAWSQVSQDREYLLFTQQTMMNILRDSGLGLGDVRPVCRHDFGDLKTLQAFEGVDIIEHVAIGRSDDVGGDP